MDSVTEAEEGLFDTELSSIELCEDHLSPTKDSETITMNGKAVLPDWLDRSGAPEAVEVGADLRNRYDQLGIELVSRSNEGAQLYQKVLGYEAEYEKFNGWLEKEREVYSGFSPPTITTEEIRQQIKEVKVSSIHVIVGRVTLTMVM